MTMNPDNFQSSTTVIAANKAFFTVEVCTIHASKGKMIHTEYNHIIMEVYKCTGSCQGTSMNPGTCQDDDCEMHDQSLTPVHQCDNCEEMTSEDGQSHACDMCEEEA